MGDFLLISRPFPVSAPHLPYPHSRARFPLLLYPLNVPYATPITISRRVYELTHFLKLGCIDSERPKRFVSNYCSCNPETESVDSGKDVTPEELSLSDKNGKYDSHLPYADAESKGTVGEYPGDALLAETDWAPKVSAKRRRAQIVEMLRKGMNPLEVLTSRKKWNPVEFWGVVDFLKAHRRYAEALQVFEWWKAQPGYKPNDQHYTYFIQMLGKAQRPDLAQICFDEMKALAIKPSVATLSSLLQGYAECGFFDKAEQVLTEMIQSNTKPNAVTYTGLIYAYGKHGLYDNMARTFNNMKTVGCCPDVHTYCNLIQAYAKGGLFRRMEKTCREMDLQGWRPDPASINAIIQAYAEAGLVKEMGWCYSLLKDYSFFLKENAIRAIAMALIRQSKFYQLKDFVKDVDLTRKDMGCLLWNLLLLSYSANFQMKNLLRGFQAMKEAGFSPDLTTFNILALGFSRMQMFWELHIGAMQMHSKGILPDVVTFGAVVDAYLKGRLPFKKLYDALDELQVKDLHPDVRTDPLVLEAFGRGDFQQSCEALLQSSKGVYGIKWTYGKITSAYLARFAKPPRSQARQMHMSGMTRIAGS